MDQVLKLRERFGLQRVVLAGDRGLLTQVQIDRLKRHPRLGWVSALRAGQVRSLVAELRAQQAEGAWLDAAIAENPHRLGFGNDGKGGKPP